MSVMLLGGFCYTVYTPKCELPLGSHGSGKSRWGSGASRRWRMGQEATGHLYPGNRLRSRPKELPDNETWHFRMIKLGFGISSLRYLKVGQIISPYTEEGIQMKRFLKFDANMLKIHVKSNALSCHLGEVKIWAKLCNSGKKHTGDSNHIESRSLMKCIPHRFSGSCLKGE